MSGPKFFVEKENFQRDIRAAYTHHFEPASFIQFPVILPFHIPVPNGTCATFLLEEPGAHTLVFNTVSIGQPVAPGLLVDDPLMMEANRTFVEMLHVTAESWELGLKLEEDTLSEEFDTLLSRLNQIISAYLVTVKDVDVYKISIPMLQFASVYRLVNLRGWEPVSTGLLLLHHDLPYEREVLEPEEFRRILFVADILGKQLNPFGLSEEIMLNGKRKMKDGFYRDAVIDAQTSIETLLNVLYVHMRLLEGANLADSENELETTGFITRVKKEYHARLGGIWDVTNAESDVGRWYISTYKLRNKVVHSGYDPSFEEAEQALVAAYALRYSVVNLISRHTGTYKELHKYLVAR